MSISTVDPSLSCWFLSGQLAEHEPVRKFFVDRFPFQIGRRGDVALSIPSPTVSGLHAEIVQIDGALFVQDLGSTNGTFVNGMRVSEPCPIRHGDLIQFAQVVLRAGFGRSETSSNTIQGDAGDRALALVQFDTMMTERAVTPHYQPIIDIDTKQAFGYEVLARSKFFGLTEPHIMFSTAAVLNMEGELSRVFREEGALQVGPIPEERTLFVNTHPVEMLDVDLLIFSLRELRELVPNRPLVLEIHESSVTRREPMLKLKAAISELQIGLAYDDFGAGQARLIELVEVPPDYLKFDMKLVQDIHRASAERQNMIAHLVRMVEDLGIQPLAEGIELEEDHETCKKLGFTCAQGYYYGRPAPADTFESEEAERTTSTGSSVGADTDVG